MKDWRRAYSFSNCSGQVVFFFFLRSGITIASLKTEGKTPVRRDLLIMAVTAESRWSKHLTKRDVGIGSREHFSERISKLYFRHTELTQVEKSRRKIRCTDHLLASSAKAFSKSKSWRGSQNEC